MRIILTILIFLAIFSCNQSGKETMESKEATQSKLDPVLADTSYIAIIPFDTACHWLFAKARPSEMNSDELKLIENILRNCVLQYNPGQKKEYEEISKKFPNEKFSLEDFIIELEGYKRQYVAVINGKTTHIIIQFY
jgi:hypothetical protein